MSITGRDDVLEQYRNATNLDARVGLHDRFSTNRQGWHPWVFAQLDLAPGIRVLEIGSGPGHLWRKNLARIAPETSITLTDLSAGMMAEARRSLANQPGLRFAVADAQHLPFGDASFEVVIANHMLYHVPDRDQALAEIRRVLRRGGRFYASTIGRDHLRELGELVSRFAPTGKAWSTSTGQPDSFTLENGAEQIARHFTAVTLARYEDALVVTAAGPLLAYILSGSSRASLGPRAIDALDEFIRSELASRGSIRVT